MQKSKRKERKGERRRGGSGKEVKVELKERKVMMGKENEKGREGKAYVITRLGQPRPQLIEVSPAFPYWIGWSLMFPKGPKISCFLHFFFISLAATGVKVKTW